MKEQRKVEKLQFFLYGFLLLLLILFCIFLAAGKISAERMTESEKINQISPVALEGTYRQTEGDQPIPFQSAAQIQTNQWKQILIEGHVREAVPAGKEVMLYSYRVPVRILINGKEVFYNPQSENICWEHFISPGIAKEDTIRIELMSFEEKPYEKAFQLVVSKLCVGTEYGLLRKQISQNLLTILASIAMMLIGLVVFVSYIIMTALRVKQTRGYLSCGLLILAGAACTFINYEYITLIFINADAVNIVDFLLQVLICECLLIYQGNYLVTKKFRQITNVMVDIWTILTGVYLLGRMAGVVNERQMEKIVIPVIIVLLLFEAAFLIHDYIRYQDRNLKMVLLSSSLLAVCTFVEILNYYKTNVFWIGVFQAGLLAFSVGQSYVLLHNTGDKVRKAERARELEIENVHQRMALMLSQIKPHFLYNALGTIRALCAKDASLARTATEHFAKYLRANMEAVENQSTISFEQEIQHVKSYLYIEKLQYGEELKIEYDLKEKEFMIPPLALQTMVENAVKHGIRGKRGGGTVSIASRMSRDAYVITVTDDGKGFEPDQKLDDSESHIGIANTRHRIEEISHGTVSIESAKGKGTTVTICIPKGENVV